jgi:hemerythrin-like domain-containing protein
VERFHSLEEGQSLLSGVLAALLRYGEALEQGAPVEHLDLKRFAHLLQQVSEYSLNTKEEELLLPELVRAGADWDSSPIREARASHLAQRHWLSVLSQASEREVPWTKSHVKRVVSTIREYASWRAEGVRLAKTRLYPQAILSIPPERLKVLEGALEGLDGSEDNGPRSTRLNQLAAQLVQRYGAA